jgi:hypothetical protein
MKKEEVKVGLLVEFRDGMGTLYTGHVAGIENSGISDNERGSVVIVELFGGDRKWVEVDKLSKS